MKKALALLLVLVLALGMSTTAFAAASGPIAKEAPDWDAEGVLFGSSADPSDREEDDPVETNLKPGDKIWAELGAAFFGLKTDSEGEEATLSDEAGPTKKDITSSKVSIRSRVKKGAVAIDSVGIDYDGTNSTARVYVKMVDPFKNNNTDGLDFEVEVYFVIDGSGFSGSSYVFSGNLCNPVFEIDADTYYAYLSDGAIADVISYVREVEYELMDDGGVILVGSAIKGAKYWGIANNSPTEAQVDLMDEYDIDEVINLNVIGLDRIAKKVNLSIANPSDYVYDKDMKYLGRAKDDLPFSTTYYLTTALLDIEEEPDEDEEPLEDDYEDPAEGGGDDSYLDNINDNPGTGK